MRCFVALEVSETVRRELGRWVTAREDSFPPARWVGWQNYHLTLVFLGELSDSQAEKLGAKLGPVFGSVEPFEARFRDGGCFPENRPARVVWLALDAPQALDRLQGRVAEICARELSYEADHRAYRPHLTLARCRRPWSRDAVKSFRDRSSGPVGPSFTFRHGALVESRLRSTGAAYRAVENFPLGAA